MTRQPADLAAALRQLATLPDRHDELLRQLVTPTVAPERRIASITDPVERAVAATRALAVAGQLRAVRDHDIRQVAGPPDATMDGAAAGRLAGVTRARVDQILDQAPPDLPDPTEADPTEADPTEADPTEADPTEADPTEADPVVAAILRLDDPTLRLRAVHLALIDHLVRRPALTTLQHTAVRSAIADGHITQAALADRLGKHPTWPTSTVGLPAAARRGRGRTSTTAVDRRRKRR